METEYKPDGLTILKFKEKCRDIPIYFLTDCLLKLEGKYQPKKIRVMFNPPATILWIGNEKYISKAHDEEFDEEKGLLMCLAKAAGISHLKLKKLLKDAERPKKKETRPVHVGKPDTF